jgi:undecaprenyl-diphosphatase
VKIILYFHSLWPHHWLNGVMVFIAAYGLIVSVTALVAGVARRRAYRLLPWVILGGVVAVGLDLLGGHAIVHQRPFVVLHVEPLLAHPADNSFPSDHSAVAAYFAAILWFVDIRAAIISTVAAIAIGIARVYCLVHWPVDVMGGWLIGVLPVVLIGIFLRKGSPGTA